MGAYLLVVCSMFWNLLARGCPGILPTTGVVPPTDIQTTDPAAIHVLPVTTATTDPGSTMAMTTTGPQNHGTPLATPWTQCTGTTTDMTDP